MSNQTIKCPQCGTQIELTEVLTGQIEQSVRVKYEAEAAKKEKELAAKEDAIKKQVRELAAQKQSMDEQVASLVKDERAKLATEKRDLEKQSQQIDEQVAEKVKAERKAIAEKERTRILAEQSEEMRSVKEELAQKNLKLIDLQKQEIELRKTQRELQQKQQEMELENQRKLDAEREKIKMDARKQAVDEQALRVREKDDKIDSLMKQINDLQRKAEQGSQEAQGEALEGALLDSLKQAFPFDQFEEVKKGQRGADILQIVRNANAKECGKILWESKYTKAFTANWIAKLKSDQQEAGADIAALVTIALPKEVKHFGQYENVWVADFTSSAGLAAALRMSLINAARAQIVAANQETAKDWVYRYVTGQEFSMQVRAIADAFVQMKANLDSEKRAMEKIWKSREKQIETVLGNVAGIRGSLEGYVGKALPGGDTMSLDEIGEDGEEIEFKVI